MDNFEASNKKYNTFLDALELRIAEIGTRRNRTIREAQRVAGELFRATGGDASKVADQMIEAEYDKLDQ